MTDKQTQALKLALEALNELIPDVHDWYGAKVHRANAAITAIREALAEQPAQQQEPVRLRRGNILRCIETDELCTVWSTSTTGKTLVKWKANDFGAYTTEQIGALFWLEPEPNDLELAAENSDNYAAFHAGYRFAVAHSLAEQPAQQQEHVGSVFRYGKDSSGKPWHDIRWTASGLDLPDGTLIYTSPQPSKPWVGLTPQDFTGMDVSNAFEAGAWWADVTLQEKNAAPCKPLTDAQIGAVAEAAHNIKEKNA